MTNVFENTQKLDVEEAKEKTGKSATSTDDLTVIKGIGPSTVLKLNRANINSIKQLADVSPDELSIVSGVNINTAEKFISEAKNHLPEFNFETFDVAEVFIEEKLLQEESEEKEVSLETTQEKWIDDLDSELEIEVNEEKSLEQIDDFFNEESLMVEEPKLEENSREETPIVPEISDVVEIDNFPELVLTQDERADIKDTIEDSIRNSGYYIIPSTIHPISSFMEKIDYIGCKLIRVSKWVNHIFLIPIQICDLEGTVLVDEVKIGYNIKHKSSQTGDKSRLRHYRRNLEFTRDLIFDDIINNSKFREFFQKYFQVNLALEKSVENKKLFFTSGQTQYKVLLEPIILCKTPPRCMEKTISFPYQRNTNIHVIHHNDLSQLLGFLEHKYLLIESRTKDSSVINNYQKTDKKFRTNVRIASLPLVLYAIALAIIYFAKFFSLLRLFNGIGFAIVGIYIFLLVYLYFKFYRTKKALAKEFETPYYMQDLEFSEVDLLEFKEQFTTEYLTQFGYECFGKERSFKVLEKIEKESFLSSSKVKKDVPIPQFQSEPEEKKEEALSYESSKYNNKYLSFLDD